MKNRWLALVAGVLLAACASATQAPLDAGVDLSAGKCDPRAVFAACSDQCHMPICIVAAATCMGTQWICDCARTGPCKDLSPSD